METIYGKNAAIAYLKSGKVPTRMYFSKNGDVSELIHLAKKYHIQYEMVDRSFLDRKVKAAHQGVVLEIESYEYASLEEITSQGKGLILVCDGLEDPHNLGAILRSCDAVGVDGVIIPKHRSVSLNATVAKVSTGAINSVKVAQVTNLVASLEKLKEQGYWVVGVENGIDAQDYTDFRVDMPLVLVLGSEGKGISRLVLKTCDLLVTIPMSGTVNSLNVSVAAALLLFEVKRRRL